MPQRVAVDTADGRLAALLRESCRELIVTEGDSPSADLQARRRELPDGTWELTISRAGNGRTTPIVTIPGNLLEREGEHVGALISALVREVCERSDAAVIMSRIEELATADSPQALFERFVEMAREISGAERVSLMFPDPAAGRFDVVSGDPVTPEGWMAEIGPDGVAPLDFAPPSEDGQTARELVPLYAGPDVFGFVRFEWSEWDEKARHRVESFVRRASPLMQTARALSRERELAMRDDLTRAYNRRFFDIALHEEIERARRFSTVVSLIFLDLDDLKLINSRWGHLTGSRVLQEVARRILGAVRSVDRVVRFGGDEFCIVLPQTEPVQARLVAERVRDAISGSPIRFSETDDIALSASFGIASYPLHSETRDGVIRAADAAMYSVKCSTKNAIGVAPLPESAQGELAVH